MFIHIKYPLQVTSILQWSTRDTTIRNNTRAVFINNLLTSYGDVTNPIALHPCRAYGDDKSWLTEETVRDRVKPPANMKWAGIDRHHGQSQRLS